MLKKLTNFCTCFYCKTPEASYFEPSSRLTDFLRRTGIPQQEPGDSREVLEEKVGQVLKTHFNYLSKDTPPNSHTWKELGQEVVNRVLVSSSVVPGERVGALWRVFFVCYGLLYRTPMSEFAGRYERLT